MSHILHHLLINFLCSYGCKQKEKTGNAMRNVTKKQMHVLPPVLARLSIQMHASVQIKFTVFSVGLMNPLGQEHWALETQSTNEFFMEQSSLLWREEGV